MSELLSLLPQAETLRRRGQPFVTATVVGVRGSSYRRPGARMLLTEDRWVGGSVSGGCLEDDLAKRAFWLTRSGEPVMMTYEGTSEGDAGGRLGLGCDGAVDVLLERAGAGRVDPFLFARGCAERQRCGAIATVLSAEGWPLGARLALRSDGVLESDLDFTGARSRIVDRCRASIESRETRAWEDADGRARVLIEAVCPAPRLFVFGDRHDAVPLVALSKSLGWEVFVCVPSVRVQSRERFVAADSVRVGPPEEHAKTLARSDRPMAVVMGHDYERDRAALSMLLASRARYVAVLGPRRRTRRMLDDLGLSGDDLRLHAPAGLELGAETPEEIALAIVAEAQSVIAGTAGRSLCERTGSIHDARGRTDSAAE